MFELGAVNGIVAEALTNNGVETIVGIDIIEEAAQAALRDRSHVYQDYLVEDLTNLSSEAREKLKATPFNCLISVAALGFGDIPPLAFASAFNYVNDDGWVAFNIKSDFLTDREPSGFSQLIHNTDSS